MIIKNPIVRGVYPDPSVCYCPDNKKYYMVNSSFEYFPGVPLLESEDLINWKHIGHCLTRPNQVNLKKINSSGGVFAPTIRYHEGRFYMVTTNDTYHKNFYVYTDNIYGEWSDPIFVDQGGIDPSLFFEDGKTYFMSNGSDPEDGRGCIFQCEINVETGERLTESRPIWKGNGGRYLESPHLFKINGKYYITAAEGGTEYGHMITCARGDSPYGPFVGCPGNPIITNRNLGGYQSIIQGVGHGDLVFTPEGESFILCLGFRQIGEWIPYHNLGRETFIVPVKWENGWPVCGDKGCVYPEMEMNISCVQEIDGKYDVSFESVPLDNPRWLYLREYDKDKYSFDGSKLTIKGSAVTLDDVDSPSFVGVRQSEFETELSVEISGDAAEAGVSFYLRETNHYDLAMVNDEKGRGVILRLHIGDAISVVERADIDDTAKLHIKSTGDRYYFYVNVDGDEKCLGSAAMKYLSSEVDGGFTGTVMGMYVVDKDGKTAAFKSLDWKQKAR